ncbi:MAG TPA: hypothetical protein ENN65_01805 [Candidatus Hydrogenedentes bacterium]|nr:hypothetical protein [Candidatus Hydrogenedentota bacterium]
MSINNDIQKMVNDTPFVDTHTHLWEESTRLAALEERRGSGIPASDIGMLFSHYTDSDLIVSGMPEADLKRVFNYDVEPKDKWGLLAPYYERVRLTGYGRFVRASVRMLYGEDDIHAGNVEAISEKLRAAVKPGYYRTILRDVANVEYAHVNSLQTPVFMETEMPDLLLQDLSTVALGSGLDITAVREATGKEADTLKEWHGVIDWCFETYGPRAIATKNQSAYARGLDYAPVSAAEAAPIFARYRKKPGSVSPVELKSLQDHLAHYCIHKATEYHLPVKLHLGYFAGHGGMPLHRVRHNAGDICLLAQEHRDARFDLFHINYPYQDEIIALAKHYPNVWVDMCWAWIINPEASVRFLKEFLMAVPANKVLCFGADVLPVELVPGHAAVARKGIAQAITELIEENWIAFSEVEPLVQRLMRGNALELFEHDGKIAAWGGGRAAS